MKKILKFIANILLRPLHLEVRSVFSGGRLFPESFKLLKEMLPPPENEPTTVIDIGVADGTPELWKVFSPVRYKYLLIEANPAYKKRLQEFTQKMSAESEQVFCGDHDGTETFITDKRYDPGKASKYSRSENDSTERSNIPSLTLDTILTRHTLPKNYIIKIDVEGAELDVLRGAVEALKHTHALIVETPVLRRKNDASNFGDIISLLDKSGFAVFDIAEMSYEKRRGFLNISNTIFIRKDNARWRVK